jgi:ribosomal protein L37AE/L43A
MAIKHARERPKLRGTRAIVEPLAIVSVLRNYEREFDHEFVQSEAPGQYNHWECPSCGHERSLSVVINPNGSGAWNCHSCFWKNEPGEVQANRRRGKAQPKLHWYDTLRPSAQAWFAELLREQCETFSNLPGLIAEDGEWLRGDQLVESVREIALEDRRVRKAWNAAVRLFKGEMRTAVDVVKEEAAGKDWPPKWIVRDAAIQANLARRGNRTLLDLYALLWDERWSYQRTEHERWELDDGIRPVLVEVSYERAKNALALSRDQTESHLRAMAAWGIICDSGHRTGRRGQKLWILGRWVTSGLHPAPVRFLRESPEMRTALRRINVWTPGYGQQG